MLRSTGNKKKSSPVGSKPISSRDALIQKLHRHVPRLAQSLVAELGLQPEVLDDLVGAGYLGLVEAAERFDPERNDDFQGYASWRIRGEMFDHLRRSSQLSRAAWRTLTMLRRYQEQLEGEGSFEAESLEDVADQISAITLRTKIEPSDQQPASLLEPVTAVTPETEVLNEEMRKLFREIIDTFPPNEKAILVGHYYDGRPFNELEIAGSGYTKSWVSRLHTRALERLRQAWKRKCEIVLSPEDKRPRKAPSGFGSV